MSKFSKIFFAGIVIFILFFCSCTRTLKEAYIFPDGYEGPVIVVFDQKDGKPEKYNKEGYQIFEIGNNGVLRTQSKIRFGYVEKKFFYKKPNGALKELIKRELNDGQYTRSNQIYESDGSTGIDNDVYSEEFFVAQTYNRLAYLRKEFGMHKFNADSTERYDSKLDTLYMSIPMKTQ